jgi:starch synthase
MNSAEAHGQLNCLKAGLNLADALTTVSPRYAREICTEELGCGLDGLLRERQTRLVGILNGVDYGEWNTNKNRHLVQSYSVGRLAGKKLNKLGLQQQLGLPADESIPLFGTISRLAEQKGVDIQLAALAEMLNTNMQFVVLGSGSPEYERGYRDLAHRFPGKVSVTIGYDETLAHRIEAGCDFFLMPSRFEPCGLNQMYSQVYGTVPIVSKVGGLIDTVTDADEFPENGTGLMCVPTAESLGDALHRALRLYADKARLGAVQRRGMARDFSWKTAAAGYERLYQESL